MALLPILEPWGACHKVTWSVARESLKVLDSQVTQTTLDAVGVPGTVVDTEGMNTFHRTMYLA